MANKRPGVSHETATFGTFGREDLAGVVAGEKVAGGPEGGGCPVEGVAFGFVHAEGGEGFGGGGWEGEAGCGEGMEIRRYVVDEDLAVFEGGGCECWWDLGWV